VALEIVWTLEAEKKFENIIDYLLKVWSEKEVIQFVETTDKVANFISEYPRMFRKTDKRNVYEALITKQNLMVYKVFRNRIVIITFWDTRQDPKKKKYLSKGEKE
jgi:plasmid stabilization system protein ParE